MKNARTAEFTGSDGKRFTAVYEQPAVVRITHWIAALCICILIGSGVQIFFAFPSFGAKVPQHNLFPIPDNFHLLQPGAWFKAISVGQWLAGGEWWHFTFMWIFIVTAIVYLLYEILSGHIRALLFMPRDVPGVWPMLRHYFLFGKKPEQTEQYNPLQKLAYTSALFFGVVSILSGLAMWNPVQLQPLSGVFGGYHTARIVHFAAMIGFLAFIPGHLVMVALHGWRTLRSMFTGWMEARNTN